MIVRELDPPHREQRIAIVLQALDIPWLRERGSIKIVGRHIIVEDSTSEIGCRCVAEIDG